MTTRAALAIATSVVLATAVAHADDSADHFARATRSYNVQDWAGALREYKLAYETDPRPSTLWAIAQTQRLSGDCRGAILSYRAFARSAAAGGANAADEQVKKCQADLAEQDRVASQAGATPAAAPSSAPAAGSAQASEKPANKPAEPRSWVFDPLGDVLAVGGLGGLVVGGIFLGLSASKLSAATSAGSYRDYSDSVDSGHSQRTIGALALGGGVLFTGLAVWRFAAVAGRQGDARPNATEVGFAPSPGGASFTLRSAF